MIGRSAYLHQLMEIGPRIALRRVIMRSPDSEIIRFAVLSLLSTALFARTPGDNDLKVNWQSGPAVLRLGDEAEVKVPAGYLYADLENTRKFFEKTHNITTGKELGTIASEEGKWFAVFEFDPVGFVKDDEKNKLDGSAILQSIKEGTESGNQERRKRGWEAFTVTGWIDPPHYDDSTHQLAWSILGHDDNGTESANYRTRLLGRRGVMSVELAVSPLDLNAAVPDFKKAALGGFGFTPPNRYSAFVRGDKVAEYGLTALVVGGAAAVAAKTGLLKYLFKLLIVGWKLIAVAVGAAVAFLKRLFRGRKSQSQESVANG